MNLKSKLAIISAASALAFAGVGYATWAFTESVSDSASIIGKSTAAIEASGLRVTDGADHDITNLYLICDAPTTGGTDLLAGNGIYWSTESSNDVAKKITTVTLVGSVNESESASKIVDFSTYDGHFASTATAAVAGSWVNIAATSALDHTETSVDRVSDVEYVWTLPTPSYAAVPTDVSEVDALHAEVAALSLTFSFTFNVSGVNA